MDKCDRALLAALIDNGRLTFAELAQRINLPPPAMADRVVKLEVEGVITDYHASVNLAELSLPIECVIEPQVTEEGCRSVLGEPARIPQLTPCHRITDGACVLMETAVASMPELQGLVGRLMKFGVNKISMILSTPFASHQPAGLRGQGGNGGCAA